MSVTKLPKKTGFATCSIDKKYRKVSQYSWYRGTKKYRGMHDTSIVKFWYRDISKYRQYRPALSTSHCPVCLATVVANYAQNKTVFGFLDLCSACNLMM